MVVKSDWLNNFVEKNAWGLLTLLVILTIGYSKLSDKVNANEKKINNVEDAQIVIVENQKSIIELQVNQANLVNNVAEIKADVKTLLNR